MASVHLQRGKWYGAFTDAYGKRHFQSTGKTDKAEAQRICEEWEGMAKKGETPPRIREDKSFSMKLGRAKIGATGATLPKDITYEELLDVLVKVDSLISPDSQKFHIGDYVFRLKSEIDKPIHETKKKALKRVLKDFLARVDQRNINNNASALTAVWTVDVEKCVQVAKRIPPSLRRDRLSWEYHFIVSDLETDQNLMSEWLEKAERDELSVKQLTDAIRGKGRLPK